MDEILNNLTDKILLVDDREENLFSLESMLTDDNREFLKATNGNDALKIAYKEELSLILLDVQMPEMDGFQVAEFLKSNKKTKKIPIIFVTAISKEKKYVMRGLEEGAVDYLFKPLDTDITRAKVSTLLTIYRQQIELERKNIELQKLNEEKNYFLGMAAHDLRNPLSAALTFSEFLMPDEKDPGRQDMLRHIHEASNFMLSLINNLLDVSKIESGKLKLDLQPGNIIEMMEENIVVNRLLASKKKIEILFSPAKDIPLVIFDKQHIQQVLNNLVSNAIKFSQSETQIVVGLKKGESEITISVKDNGQGIPPQEIDKLFKPFQKTSVRSTAGEHSTGLGLAIVRKIIEAHRGRIWVESEVGKGSVFSFTIPL